MIGADVAENPDSIPGSFSMKNDSLFKTKRSISLLPAMAFDAKQARLAAQERQCPASFTFSTEAVLWSELFWLYRGKRGRTNDRGSNRKRQQETKLCDHI